MQNSRSGNPGKLILICFCMLCGFVKHWLVYWAQYNNNQLLISNEISAIDLVLLVENNFQVTNDDVVHMKSLTIQ